MRFINFLVLKLAACLTLGILLGYYFPTIPTIGLTLGALLFLFLGIFWFFERRKLKQGGIFGGITFLVFISLAYVNLQRSQPHFLQNHYSHKKSQGSKQLLQVKITEILKPNRYYTNYFAEVLQLDNNKAEGKLLVSLKTQTNPLSLRVDDMLWIAAEIRDVNPPLNPSQFNYKEYLVRQGVYHRITLSENEILEKRKGATSLKGLSEGIRHTVSKKLTDAHLSEDALAITQALVLGQRKELRKELYSNYAAAGAVHILAVSGLHVGILFLFFSWVLKPLEFIRFGKLIKIISIVLLLWTFAFIAGWSPSVVRAVTMFSCFALAGLLNRPTNGFNTLFLSYFILLLVKPIWLFHVGFQLSYLAVFSILWLQPKLYELYRPKTLADKYLWGIITVTLSAQVGVAPLSIYYFHQFPGLFLLTNTVVLPFLGVLLAFGLFVVVSAYFYSIPDFVARVYNKSIRLLNGFIEWIASQESFLFKDIPFSFPKMIAVYGIIFSLSAFWIRRKKSTLFTVLTSVVVLLVVMRWEQAKYSHEELIVFHASSKSLLGYKNGKHLTLFSNDTVDWFNRHPIKGYKTDQHILEYVAKALPNVFEIGGKKILRLDSLGLYPNEKIAVLLLTENPKINLERLIDSIQPKLIIADGSNYWSYVKRWEETCRKRKLPFHNTREMGAYIFE